MSSLFDDVTRSRIFAKQAALSFDYIPQKLPYRDEELKKLANLFYQVLEQPVSQNVLITGTVGTGKTVATKYFCTEFKEYARGLNKLVEYVHINCRQRQTENMVMLGIMRFFDQNFPDRGFSTNEMNNYVRAKIKDRGCHFVVVLDEADVLIKKSGSDLIYSLTRFDEESQGVSGSVSLVLISQKYVLDMLDPAALSTFKRTNIIEFGKYNEKQLEGILDDRVMLAFKDGAMEDEVTSLIAAMSVEYGDARFAIELLEKAGMIAQEKGSSSVSPEHAREAKSIIKPFVTRERLEKLDHHPAILLLALARLLKKRAYATTGDLENMYKIICEETKQKARGHTQIWHYMNDLEAQGIINKRILHKGSDGTTTQITLLDMASAELELYLSEKIYKS